MEEKKNIVKNIYKYSGKNIDSGRNIDSEKNIQIVEYRDGGKKIDSEKNI